MHRSYPTPKYIREDAWFRCTVKQENVEIEDFSLRIIRLKTGICFSGIGLISKSLNSSTGDEEPLVDAAVDRGRGQVLALGDVGELALVDTVGGGLVGNVGAGENVSIPDPKDNILEHSAGGTYRLISPRGVLPVTSFSQASAHSRMTSVAYLRNKSQHCRQVCQGK